MRLVARLMVRNLTRILATVLTAYHKVLSPILPVSCRFYPSCSVFAAQALQQHGLRKGMSLALRRLIRCHPGHPGGYDPVV